VSRLVGQGSLRDRLEAAMAAWEAKADGEGRIRGDHAFFDGAEPWMTEAMKCGCRSRESNSNEVALSGV
jgi:hypothetical protein